LYLFFWVCLLDDFIFINKRQKKLIYFLKLKILIRKSRFILANYFISIEFKLLIFL
jgi:hypothetical protein